MMNRHALCHLLKKKKKKEAKESNQNGKVDLLMPFIGHETKGQRSHSPALGHTASDSQGFLFVFLLYLLFVLFCFSLLSFT